MCTHASILLAYDQQGCLEHWRTMPHSQGTSNGIGMQHDTAVFTGPSHRPISTVGATVRGGRFSTRPHQTRSTEWRMRPCPCQCPCSIPTPALTPTPTAIACDCRLALQRLPWLNAFQLPLVSCCFTRHVARRSLIQAFTCPPSPQTSSGPGLTSFAHASTAPPQT